MKGMLTIFKKELARFFGDRRTLITILMPGLLIYFIYSFMGSSLTGSTEAPENLIPVIAVNTVPDSLSPALIQFDLISVEDRKYRHAGHAARMGGLIGDIGFFGGNGFPGSLCLHGTAGMPGSQSLLQKILLPAVDGSIHAAALGIQRPVKVRNLSMVFQAVLGHFRPVPGGQFLIGQFRYALGIAHNRAGLMQAVPVFAE